MVVNMSVITCNCDNLFFESLSLPRRSCSCGCVHWVRSALPEIWQPHPRHFWLARHCLRALYRVNQSSTSYHLSGARSIGSNATQVDLQICTAKNLTPVALHQRSVVHCCQCITSMQNIVTSVHAKSFIITVKSNNI